MITAEPAIPIRQPGRSLAELIERESKRRRPSPCVVVDAARCHRVGCRHRVGCAAAAAGAVCRALPHAGRVAGRSRARGARHGSRGGRDNGAGGSRNLGRIATVEVDYNARVKAGQVLARFDRTALSAQLAQTKATLAASRAAVEQARTDRNRTGATSHGPSSSTRRRFLADAESNTTRATILLWFSSFGGHLE